MRALLIIFFVVSAFKGLSQSAGPLYSSDFYRLNHTDVKIKSYFSGSANFCFQTQYRFNSVSNDTLFLSVLFDVRTAVTSNFCNRLDTVSTAQISSDFSFINVSTGVVKFGEFDTSPPDTVWSVYDSTFNAQLSIPEYGNSADFTWNTSNGELTLISDAPLQSIELIDLNGKTMLYTKENQFDIAFLKTGVYLMRVLTESGTSKTVRWFRP